MAEKTEIEIIIAPSGEVKFRVIGGPADACNRMAVEMSESLGPIVSEDRTEHHYHPPQTKDIPKGRPGN